MYSSLIGEDEARDIAERFLRQHYSVAGIGEAVLRFDTWVVDVTVSEPKNKTFRVTINAESGQVVSWK